MITPSTIVRDIESATASPIASPTPSADSLTAIKARQRATWGAVDFGVIGTTLQIVGESLCEAVDLRAGSKVLDVAAGNGNCSLAAARRWCDVTSTDYVAAFLDGGRRRADAEGLSIRFKRRTPRRSRSRTEPSTRCCRRSV
jgi:2-polyprenyl-3-methyl-5-hydroxy-6-metoxy-1,4-benzoquinol methylase